MASQDMYLSKPERKLFLPFIEDLLDCNEIEGLHWIDKEQRIFRMPWKHMKRHDYEMGRDSALFRAWAVNSGKFKENDQDPSRWKINFRSALNTMKHVFQELEDKSDDDCRVFRINQPDGQSRKRKASVPPDRLRTSLPIKPCAVNGSAFYGMTSDSMYSSSYWLEPNAGHIGMAEPSFAWMPPTPAQESQQWLAANGAFGTKAENGVNIEDQVKLKEEAKLLTQYFHMTEVYADPQHRTFQGFFSVSLNSEVHTVKIRLHVIPDYPLTAPQCEVTGDDDIAIRCQAALADFPYLQNWEAESSTLYGLADAIRSKLSESDLKVISAEAVTAVKQQRASHSLEGSGFLNPESQAIVTPCSPKAFQPYRRDSGENSSEDDCGGEHADDEEGKQTKSSTPPPLLDMSDDEVTGSLATGEGSCSKANELAEGSRVGDVGAEQAAASKSTKSIPNKHTEPAAYIEYLQGELQKCQRQSDEQQRRLMIQEAQITDLGIHIEELVSKCRHERLQADEYRTVLSLKRGQLRELEAQLTCLRRRDRMSQLQQCQGIHSYWAAAQHVNSVTSKLQSQPPKSFDQLRPGFSVASNPRMRELNGDGIGAMHADSSTDDKCKIIRKSPNTVLIMPPNAVREDDEDHRLYIDEHTSSPAHKDTDMSMACETEEANLWTGTPPPSPDAIDKERNWRKAGVQEDGGENESTPKESANNGTEVETHPQSPDTGATRGKDEVETAMDIQNDDRKEVDNKDKCNIEVNVEGKACHEVAVKEEGSQVVDTKEEDGGVVDTKDEASEDVAPKDGSKQVVTVKAEGHQEVAFKDPDDQKIAVNIGGTLEAAMNYEGHQKVTVKGEDCQEVPVKDEVIQDIEADSKATSTLCTGRSTRRSHRAAAKKPVKDHSAGTESEKEGQQ